MTLYTRKHTTKTEKVFGGEIISLRLDTLMHPNGEQTTREVVEHNGGVVIACQPSADKVILIKQYRYPMDEELIELPAGRIDQNEDPFLAAKRELTEETGYEAASWQELAQMYSAPGFCNELLYLYKAADLKFVGKNLDPDEETEVLIVSLTEAWELVQSGRIRDAKTIAGLGLLRQ